MMEDINSLNNNTTENPKRNESHINESEERLSALINSTPDVICFKDGNGKWLLANDSILELYGLKDVDYLGKTDSELSQFTPLMYKKSFLTCEKTDEEAWAKGALSRSEEPVPSVDLKIRVYDVFKIPLFNKDKSRKGMVVFGRDITEIRAFEDALQLERNRLRQIIDLVPHFVFAKDYEGRFFLVNNAVAEVYGTTVEELTGKMDADFAKSEKEAKHFRDDDLEVMNSHQMKVIPEEEITDSKGKTRFLNTVKIPYTFSGFLKPSILGVSVDITDKKKKEEENKLLIYAIKSISESVTITDMNDKILFVNDAFVKTYGYKEEEIIGKPITVLRSPNNSPEVNNILKETLAGKWQGELLNVKKDGTEFPVYLSATIIRDSEGKAEALIGVSKDISKEKYAEQELINAKNKAEEASLVKSNFLANMSHELRTPLVGILGFAEILKSETINNTVKSYADFISQSGNRLLETLNSILDLSRIEKEKTEINLLTVDVIKSIKDIVYLFTPVAKKKNLLLIEKYETNELPLVIDENLFRGAINNLINNAVKYTNEGSISVIVSEEKIDNVNCGVIKIIDTGIGISENNLKFIFDEFRQVSEGKNRNFDGSGLGLTLSKKFIEKMNGKISVESKENIGTAFTVVFPCKERIKKKPKSGNLIPDADLDKKNNLLKKILLVDNDELIFKVVKKFLEGVCKVDYAPEAEKGIKKINLNKYSLILLDINLGSGMSGIEAIAGIRKIKGYESTPCVALTAFAMLGDKEEFLSAGCTHYMSKPFTKESLIDLITGILNENN